MKKILITTATMLGSIAVLHSQTRIYVNEYLNIGVGARGLSMAGAQAASSHDVYSTYWNPAGLLLMENDVQVGLMHAEYFGGISKYDFGAAAIPIDKGRRAIGISFIRFGTDNIPYTLDYVRPDGSFDESKLRGISAGDYAGTFSYAQRLNWLKSKPEMQLRFGANAKVIYRNIGSMANAWGVGVDAGFQMDYKRWKFGAMLKDITGTYTSWSFHLTDQEKIIFGQTGNEIPVKSSETMLPRLNLGAAYGFLKPENKFQLLAELNADITTDGKRQTLLSTKTLSIDPRLGIEAGYKHTVYLRAGVSNFYQVLDNSDTTNQAKYTVFQPSVGVGFKIKAFNIDYSFTSLQVQSAPLMSHIISIRLDINKAKGRKDTDSTRANTIDNNKPNTLVPGEIIPK